MASTSPEPVEGPQGARIPAERRRIERRRRRAAFRLRERRSGFDRRLPRVDGSLTGRYRVLLRRLRDDAPALLLVLVGINAFNVLDYLLTLDALERGAGEANPIMRFLIEMGEWQGGLFKVTVVLLVSAAIWRYRRFRMVLQVGVLVLGLFSLIMVYQLFGRLLI